MPNDAATTLARELANLPPDLRAKLDRQGFDEPRFLGLAATLASEDPRDAATRRDVRNRVKGVVTAPRESELLQTPPPSSDEEARLSDIGLAAASRGELAFCVMAGGMATRMGGVVKALVEAVDGHTFLDLRLAENHAASEKAGRAIPLWLMSSDATDGPIKDALRKSRAPDHVAVFAQDLSLRLAANGALFRDASGAPSTYASGHGDLVDGVRRSGLLAKHVAAGGKYVWIANLDNLGAAIDFAVLGRFIESGAEAMVEVCDKEAGDRGGIPVYAPAPDGTTRLQVLEEFRLPKSFDAATVRVFNTNTFLVRAQPLASANIAWSWFEVEKKVGDLTAIQFERLLQEITSAMRSAYIRVPRSGPRSRFLPVKDHEELAKRRHDIEAVARMRGML